MKNAISISLLGFIIFISFPGCIGKDFDIHINKSKEELRIKVKGIKDKRMFDYDNRFDIKGMTGAQSDSIVHHVLDSLRVNSPE